MNPAAHSSRLTGLGIVLVGALVFVVLVSATNWLAKTLLAGPVALGIRSRVTVELTAAMVAEIGVLLLLVLYLRRRGDTLRCLGLWQSAPGVGWLAAGVLATLFAKKLEAIVGLYLNPPEHAIVMCVDEKSQIQALNRTQPGLPLKKGRCGTMTHDYKRNGTATLFAALHVGDDTVIGMCDDRHRHQEGLQFLKVIDDMTPVGKELHLINDNYATHKHAKVRRWLKRHPRFHVHFTPASASWLNIERFFRDLTQNRLRRGVFRDVQELITAIGDYIDRHNQAPKPFIWTAKASDLLEKVKPARRSLNNGQSV